MPSSALEKGYCCRLGIFWVKLAAVLGLLIGLSGVKYNPVSLTLGLAAYGIATGIVGLIIGYDTRTYKLEDVEELKEKQLLNLLFNFPFFIFFL